MCNMEKKMLPVGIESFEEIRTDEFYYVDKTGLIKDLLNKRGKVNLFTRPRRFGKSLNMSMLKYFLEYGCDKTLFDGLEVANDNAFCEKYMGRYPVVSISLKNVNGADYAMARSLLCSVIGDEALRFEMILLGSDKLTATEKECYKQLIAVDMNNRERFMMPDSVLMDGLKTLSGLLRKHYEKKVIILIDEYDVPLAKAYEQGYYDEILFLIRNILEQALKTNDNLHFAVLTGCLRISKESIFTGLNNLKVLSITSPRFNEYFGFTDSEVREMLEYYGLGFKYDTVREWYDGYRFGNADVYCPWDVISYCDELTDDPSTEPKDYWSNTSGNHVIKRFLKMSNANTRDEIERLIAGESVLKAVNEGLTYKELYDNIDHVWSVLFTTGYLTQKGNTKGELRQLVIPNREIHNIFMTQIRNWMQGKVREDGAKLNVFCDAFRSADAETVQTIFTEYLENTISIRDTAVRKELKEGFFHGFLLGLLRYKEDWRVMSNRESGIGFADIVVEIFSEKIGIVAEVKYPDGGNLRAGCQEAMKQIEDHGYVDQLYLDGMTKIIKYGIACYAKRCEVVVENV